MIYSFFVKPTVLPQISLDIFLETIVTIDVDLLKTRKRYVVIESSDFTRNIFWLASTFSKIKKLDSRFLGNQSGIAGVHIIDTTDASIRAVCH